LQQQQQELSHHSRSQMGAATGHLWDGAALLHVCAAVAATKAHLVQWQQCMHMAGKSIHLHPVNHGQPQHTTDSAPASPASASLQPPSCDSSSSTCTWPP
jgi:hypothetical protein